MAAEQGNKDIIKLSVLIPTIFGREEQFERLYNELHSQRMAYSNPNEIEIVWLKDNKELSIGSKRNKLYQQAKGVYSVSVDDDDHVPEYFIAEIMEALKQEPDCIGYLEQCTMNGEVKIACHSNRFKDWKTNYAGYDYVRTIFYKDVIKTAIAKKVGVHDMRFGEDHNFAKRLKISRLLQKEVFIDKIMYLYEHNSMSKKEYKLRYGIK